ncbi:MAG: chitobiase/beta-hexosaminidase C-terminal domain-containing protein [Bacteroidales bacterium]|nr:chitobiase/beta-hexosaminidase C-terminal domain-containing protein [Bacteroidales bacterium]
MITKNNKFKLVFGVIMVSSLLTLGNLVLASEYEGELTTGINASTTGDEMEATVMKKPTANPSAGSYTSTQNIILTANGASSIHYTIDGTDPTCSTGTDYTVSISIDSTKTIKAISCYSENHSSAVASFLYTITSVDGSNQDVSLTSDVSGRVNLPEGATNINLSNNTVMDVSGGVNTVTARNVTIGGQFVTVNQAVVLESGVDGQPFTLSNSNLAGVSVSIPDSTTISASSGWDGKITPPTAGSSAGTAPSGFSVGGTVIEVGSSSGVLVFDKPVLITFSGVTGSVGYKPSGSSTWVQITNTCGGIYDLPTAPISPNECYISNGTDTKIYTYHFTSFASLDTVTTTTTTTTTNNVVNVGSSSGISSSSASTYIPPTTIKKGDANNDNKVDRYDFALMMSNWGKAGTNVCDFNNDSKVDRYDFALLMVNWNK